MNVYVRELSSALARLGHDVEVFTRRDDASLRHAVEVEPGFSVRHVAAGPSRALTREELPQFIDQFADAVAARFRCAGAPDAIHANYWLSGTAGHRLKHEFDVPLITTFHTLELVKASTFEAESPERAEEESKVIGCSDAVLASCDVEADQIVSHYGADPARVHVVPLGVEHAFFAPGHRPQARLALGFDPSIPLLVYAGRLQALKGVDLALETLIELHRRDVAAHLAIIGGPSGPSGFAMLDSLHRRACDAHVVGAVSFIAPQPHELLSTWLRAADATLVPSRAESFGLAALESMACGTPVIASAVGGLTSLVTDGETGRLLESRRPEEWADAVSWALDERRSTLLSTNAVLQAREYTWRAAGTAVAGLIGELSTSQLVSCP